MSDFWRGKRVFLTGHTGFKGSWMCHVLLRQGADLTGYSLPPPTEPALFALTGLAARMKSREGDIRDFERLQKAVHEANPEIVIHMAAQALVRESFSDPVGTFATNVMGTVHLLEAVRKSSARVVINVTSDKCYENREWVWGYRENEAMGGSDPYSSSKGCAELVTQAYRKSFYRNENIRLASARAGNVIGGGDWARDRLIPDAVRAFSSGQKVVLRNPKSTRPWQHVVEPVYAYLSLAEKVWQDPAFAEGWNFGPLPDGAQTVEWVMKRFAEGWGGQAGFVVEPSQIPEAHFLQLDCSKARTLLKWTPRLNAGQALALTAEWYRDFYAGGAAAHQLVERDIEFYENLLVASMAGEAAAQGEELSGDF
ncbi:MAG: CDP-glucose 4,6-dehydratase [Bdellovibrio sp.]|nr:MAG: CDP-glucose 4,6-dehydratase [Bdellovibrio sp.]